MYLHAAHDVLLNVTPSLLAVVLCLFAGVISSADRQALSAMLIRLRLNRQQAVISAVFGASIDGILILDSEGRIQDANPSSGRLLGTPRNALVGRQIRSFATGPRPLSRRRRQHPRRAIRDARGHGRR